MPVHPGVMRASGATHVISVITSPAPPIARVPRCDQMKLAGRSVVGRIHVHRRDDHAIDDRHAAQRERREHGRQGRNGFASSQDAGASRPRGKPPLDALEIAGIAQPEALVAHALAPRQQRVGELLRLHRDVALDVLEPLRRIARGVLQPQRLGHALVLIRGERVRRAGRPAASSRASAIASSIASLVPDPIEKCAVCAASPMSTMFP